jgi:hypothetical protein
VKKSPTMQSYLRRCGIPAGLVMLVAFGPAGWLLNSTFLGILAGMGLMLVVLSYSPLFKRAR